MTITGQVRVTNTRRRWYFVALATFPRGLLFVIRTANFGAVDPIVTPELEGSVPHHHPQARHLGIVLHTLEESHQMPELGVVNQDALIQAAPVPVSARVEHRRLWPAHLQPLRLLDRVAVVRSSQP